VKLELSPITLASTIAENDVAVSLAGSGEARGVLRGYPGSKGGVGVIQTIINNIPPCDTFIEAFAGTGFVTHSLRPAASRTLIDVDAAVCETLRLSFIGPRQKTVDQFAWDFGAAETAANASGLRIIRADAVRWLETHRRQFGPRTVIYFDPPYLVNRHGEERRDYYQHEFKNPEQHVELLKLCERLSEQDVVCLISGYRCPLYDSLLSTWRRIDYTTATRRGAVVESLWCNFPEPWALHDYRYLGKNFRERERIKRKQKRWRNRLETMNAIERAGIINAVRDLLDENGEAYRQSSTEVANA
jgi:DNA adenine methylase